MRSVLATSAQRYVPCLLAAAPVLLLGTPSTAQAYDYQPQPDNAAVMFIGAHPDDEGIFLGGTLAYYTQTRNLPSVSLTLTTGAWDGQTGNLLPGQESKLQEFPEAVWRYGFRNEPVLPLLQQTAYNGTVADSWRNFSNGPMNLEAVNDVLAGKERTSRYLAEQIRLYRPDVIVTLAQDGEYGHPDHKTLFSATAAAFELAAGNTAYLSDETGSNYISADGLAGDPWSVSKMYVSRYGQRQLFHDGLEANTIDTDGDGVPDQSARGAVEFGLDALSYTGDADVSTVFETGDLYDAYHSEWYGLYRTRVGLDTVSSPFQVSGDTTGSTYSGWSRGDFFEHLDLTKYGEYLADFNRDGIVGQLDLDILNANWGNSVPLGATLLGDADGNGVVGEGDLALLQDAWNEQVPEPGSLGVVVIGGLVLLRRKARLD